MLASESAASTLKVQCTFSVGPCEGISMGNELWMAHYLLIRVAEQWGAKVSFHFEATSGQLEWCWLPH